MEGTPIYEDAVTRVMNLMRTTFGDTFAAYYEGDPQQIPKANLPCLIVETLEGRVDLGPTQTDELQTRINIRLVFNKESDFNQGENYDLTERKLRLLVEARDPATNHFMPNTVLGALRTNFTLRSQLIANDVDWQYDINPRADNIVTSEALVQIRAEERIFIPNRT